MTADYGRLAETAEIRHEWIIQRANRHVLGTRGHEAIGVSFRASGAAGSRLAQRPISGQAEQPDLTAGDQAV